MVGRKVPDGAEHALQLPTRGVAWWLAPTWTSQLPLKERWLQSTRVTQPGCQSIRPHRATYESMLHIGSAQVIHRTFTWILSLPNPTCLIRQLSSEPSIVASVGPSLKDSP